MLVIIILRIAVATGVRARAGFYNLRDDQIWEAGPGVIDGQTFWLWRIMVFIH